MTGNVYKRSLVFMPKISKNLICLMPLLFTACAGMKVINPNEPNNKGTLAVDATGGSLRLVSTHTCNLKSMGKSFSAVGKTQAEARSEVINLCKDRTLISSCKPESVECSQN